MSGGCLEDVWGYLGGNHGNLRRSDLSECIWVPSPCSMEPKHLFGAALKEMTFVRLTILRQQNIKMSEYKVNENHSINKLQLQ